MIVDLGQAELHNVVKRRGALYVREGYQQGIGPGAGRRFVYGFTVESPFTTEPWHYLFDQQTGTGLVRLRVFTEEFVELYSYDLGALPTRPAITWASVNNQLIISSPSFSAPLYGLVGGGLVTARKRASRNPATTTLEIPPGHVARFGDRVVIAQGNVLLFSDPGPFPLTFVAQNALALGGTVYDLFQAGDGSLYAFTSDLVYIIPADAIGKGQIVEGFVSTIPGFPSSRSYNAAASLGRIASLRPDGLAFLPDPESIELAPYKGPRYWSRAVEQRDWSVACRLFPTPTGFYVGLERSAGIGCFLDVNLLEGYRSWVWQTDGAPLYYLVGVLRSRDGEAIPLVDLGVLFPQGRADGAGQVRAVCSTGLDLPENVSPVVRRVTVSSDNVGGTQAVYLDGAAPFDTVPARPRDAIIGTGEWSTSIRYAARSTRTVRHSIRQRITDPQIEVLAQGGGRIEPSVHIEVAGQGRERRDKR